MYAALQRSRPCWAALGVVLGVGLAACSGDMEGDAGGERDAGAPMGDASSADAGARPDGATIEDGGTDGAAGDAAVNCGDGFREVGGECVDIDECAEGLDACGARECRNAEGGYGCACGAGEAWDGADCASVAPTRLAMSTSHACHIDRGGTLHCWGVNANGELGRSPGAIQRTAERAPVSGDARWIAVAAGRGPDLNDNAGYTLAVRDDGSLWQWGVGPSRVAGGTDGAPVQIGAATDWRSVSGAEAIACGIRGAGELYCWGNANQGIGEDVPTVSNPDPVRIGDGTDWVQISRGNSGACGIRGAGELFCWGGGFGSRPTPVGLDADWREVRSSVHMTCALKQDDTRWCWGTLIGDDGTPTTVAEPTPMDDGGGWQRLFEGGLQARVMCGRRASGWTSCWGESAEVPQGDEDVLRPMTRADVVAGAAWGRWGDLRLVSLGLKSTGACAVTTDDAMLCWGHDDFGQHGRGTFGVSRPTPIDEARWIDVDVGDLRSCGVREDGTAWCWGMEYLEGARFERRQTPYPVFPSVRWRALRVSPFGFVGIGDDGRLYRDGRPIDPRTDWVELEMGMDAFCARGASGVLHCGDRREPTPLDGETEWTDFAVAHGSVCAIARGELHCAEIGRPLERIGPSATWTAIVADESQGPTSRDRVFMGVDGGRAVQVEEIRDGWTSTESEASRTWTDAAPPGCGLSDGQLFCWGSGSRFAALLTAGFGPFDVSALGGGAFERFGLGRRHGCGLLEGRVHCWGESSYGAVGHGLAWSTEAVEALPLP